MPPKHILYGLVNLGDQDPAFLDQRQMELNAYLDALLKTVGLTDTGFWYHPAVMTFFDIPLGSAICAVKQDVSVTLQMAMDLLATAKETNETRKGYIARGVDAGILAKQQRRQISQLQRRIEGISEVELGEQDRDKLAQLRNEVAVLLDQLNGLGSEREELLSDASIRTPAIPTATSDDPESVLAKQRELLKEQDTHLETVLEQAKRNRQIAEAIDEEVSLHNQLLSQMAGQTDEASTKLDIGQRRVKKI